MSTYCPFCHRCTGNSANSECTLSYQPPILSATTEVILDLRRKAKEIEHEAQQKAKGIYHWSNQPSGASIMAELGERYPCLGSGGNVNSHAEKCYSYCPFCGRPVQSSGCNKTSSSRNCHSSHSPQYPVYQPPPPQQYQPPQYPVYQPPPPQQYQPPQYPVYQPPPPQQYQPPQYPVYQPPPPRPVDTPQYPVYRPPQQPACKPTYPIYNKNTYRQCCQAQVQPRNGQGCAFACGKSSSNNGKISQALKHIDAASRILKTV